MTMSAKPLGLSGRLAAAFLTSEITPLLALSGLLLGLFAVIMTPREEEPQINVTFANVFIPYPGASAREVASLVTTTAERIVSEIEGVEHIYSTSTPGMSALTVQFEVGEPRTDAIVRLYNAFFSNADAWPEGLGVGPPLIRPKGIDDVPIVAGTLWSRDPAVTGEDLRRVANTLASELQRVPGTRDIEIIGGAPRVMQVNIDPQRLAGYGLALEDLYQALGASNVTADAGQITRDGSALQVRVGRVLSAPEEVEALVVGVRAGAPILLGDVANVRLATDQPEQYVSFGLGAASADAYLTDVPAVTIAVAKKPGENAVDVAAAVIARFEQLRGISFPDGIEATVTRNYGATAQDKASTLIKKLIFATLSVVVLVLLALGRKEAVVVGAAVIVTLALTLFASWAWGFTLNRVSLFALIFSIGILVDDAIVVVENIHRHLQQGGRSLTEAIPAAVDEVGGPTILATFTVVAALLPMAFVSGLMGPYMLPIPINASTGMLISLVVAFMFTPWLFRRLFAHTDHAAHATHDGEDRLHRAFRRLMQPFLRDRQGRGWRLALLLGLIVLIAASLALVAGRLVVMKMLPFDNKSEFQVLVDMPEGTPLEQTRRVLQALARHVATVEEVTDFQLHAGTAAPINFNGLVRQYYLRQAPHLGDIQVNLKDKAERSRKSHEIALSLRQPLQDIGRPYGANVKIVEVPPGPPVLAPLVAEIYGLDADRQLAVARQVREVFEQTADVVDVDDTIEFAQPRLIIDVDQARAARLGVSQAAVVDAVRTALRGRDASYLHDPQAREAIPVRIELAAAEQGDLEQIGALRLRGAGGALVPLSEIARIEPALREQSIHHKDLLPVTYVTGDVAGAADSPMYGLLAISAELKSLDIDGAPIEQLFTSPPDNPAGWSLKWDGEWQVTFETFRDMGIAYAVGLILIYLLVVAQFRSYSVPLIIMAPIPLTLIGILPGHALMGYQFGAPSMIGMIALAGIIVRNSILLVDFIQQEVAAGKPLQEATIEAAAVRARPIVLTALAAMMGGFFILDDPIFGGLAVSLIFGLLVSTLLTLLVIPVVYYAYHYRAEQRGLAVA